MECRRLNLNRTSFTWTVMLCSFQFETESEGTKLRRDVLAEGNVGLGPSTTGLVAILSGQEEMFAFRRAVCTGSCYYHCYVRNSCCLPQMIHEHWWSYVRLGSLRKACFIGMIISSYLCDWKQDAVDIHLYWFCTFSCVNSGTPCFADIAAYRNADSAVSGACARCTSLIATAVSSWSCKQ